MGRKTIADESTPSVFEYNNAITLSPSLVLLAQFLLKVTNQTQDVGVNIETLKNSW